MVNDKVIGFFRIPKNPKDEFEIIVSIKGERDRIAQRHYGIYKIAADQELAKWKEKWTILSSENETNQQVIDSFANRNAELEKQVDSLAIYKKVYHLASVNKDDAGKRVLNYLDSLEQGKTLQQTCLVLSLKNAANELRTDSLQFNAAAEELEALANASISIANLTLIPNFRLCFSFYKTTNL